MAVVADKGEAVMVPGAELTDPFVTCARGEVAADRVVAATEIVDNWIAELLIFAGPSTATSNEAAVTAPMMAIGRVIR